MTQFSTILRHMVVTETIRRPGSYSKKYFSVVQQNTYTRKAAEFSMLARRFVPGDKTKKPGPGTHWPEAVKIHKPSVPKYSMGVRHSEYITPLIENSSEI